MLFRQQAWRYCRKCQGYFFESGGGVCPADQGHHDSSARGPHVTMNESMSTHTPGWAQALAHGWDNGWAFRDWCDLLFHHQGGAGLAGAAGGGHDASRSGQYSILYDNPYLAVEAAGYQLGWSQCTACATLFPRLNASDGSCPGTHAAHTPGPAHDCTMLGARALDDTTVLASSPQEFNGSTESLMARETCMAQIRAARSSEAGAAHDNRHAG
jgi:hypothetical protein